MEVFPLILGNDWRLGLPCRLLVRECLVRDTATGPQSATAIIFVGANGGTTVHGVNKKQFAQALNNKIRGGGALGVANFYNWHFRGNEVDMAGIAGGSAVAVNIDTGHCVNGSIEENTLRNAFYQYKASGVIVIGGGGIYKDIRISRNLLHTLKNGHGYGAVKLQGNTSGIEISRNTCEVKDGMGNSFLGMFQTGSVNGPMRRRGNRMADRGVPASIADT